MSPILLAELGIAIVDGIIKLSRTKKSREARRKLREILDRDDDGDDEVDEDDPMFGPRYPQGLESASTAPPASTNADRPTKVRTWYAIGSGDDPNFIGPIDGAISHTPGERVRMDGYSPHPRIYVVDRVEHVCGTPYGADGRELGYRLQYERIIHLIPAR